MHKTQGGTVWDSNMFGDCSKNCNHAIRKHSGLFKMCGQVPLTPPLSMPLPGLERLVSYPS